MARPLAASKKPAWTGLDGFVPKAMAGWGFGEVCGLPGTFKLVAAISYYGSVSISVGSSTIYTIANANTPYVSVNPPLASGSVSSATDMVSTSYFSFPLACAGYIGTIPRGMNLHAFAVYWNNTTGDKNIFSPASDANVYYIYVACASRFSSSGGAGMPIVSLKYPSTTTWRTFTPDALSLADCPWVCSFNFMALGPTPLTTVTGGTSLILNFNATSTGTPSYYAYAAGLVLYQ
jgi:hypothetical protein